MTVYHVVVIVLQVIYRAIGKNGQRRMSQFLVMNSKEGSSKASRKRNFGSQTLRHGPAGERITLLVLFNSYCFIRILEGVSEASA